MYTFLSRSQAPQPVWKHPKRVSSPHVLGGDRFIFDCNCSLWFLFYNHNIVFTQPLQLGNAFLLVTTAVEDPDLTELWKTIFTNNLIFPPPHAIYLHRHVIYLHRHAIYLHRHVIYLHRHVNYLHRYVTYLHQDVSYLHRDVIYLHRHVNYLHRDVIYLHRRVIYLHRRVSYLHRHAIYLHPCVFYWHFRTFLLILFNQNLMLC